MPGKDLHAAGPRPAHARTVAAQRSAGMLEPTEGHRLMCPPKVVLVGEAAARQKRDHSGEP